MKVAIEGQRLFRPKKHGMDMVALELIRALQRTDQPHEYVVFVKPDEDRCLTSGGNVEVVELPGGPYPTWEQWALPRAARRYGCDLLHCTSNTAPLAADLPLVVTLHDIIYLERRGLRQQGGNWYQRLGNTYRRWNVPRVVSRCQRLLTVSHFEKENIARYFGLAPDNPRLVAIYNGVSEHFRPVTDAATVARLREKYRLPPRYFFFLGNTDPKKNTAGVLRAFSNFRRQHNADLKLVMLDYDRGDLRRLLQQIGDPALAEAIHLTGYVANTDLPVIYQECEVFLYPSLRESFGIPMLEAMRVGVPVITSDAASMPEVAGGAARLVNPRQPEQLTTAMIDLVDHPEQRATLVARGFERAAAFSWEAMATAVCKQYEAVHASAG